MRQVVEDRDARRLLGGGPVALLTTSWHGNWNVAPMIYYTPVSFDPPLIGVAIHPSRHSHEMVRHSEEFALNIPTPELLHHCQYLGSVTGAELNKFELTKLPVFSARRISAPLLEGCVGWIECGVHDAYTVGDHTLYIGKVVAASVESDAFDETWLLNDPDEKPLHYLGVNYYATLGERLAARIPAASDIKRDVEAGEVVMSDTDATEERRERLEEEREREVRGD
jgi:flavin reductase (DIM6/NTAB) family NADH-FMN oxidoreductase RutF